MPGKGDSQDLADQVQILRAALEDLTLAVGRNNDQLAEQTANAQAVAASAAAAAAASAAPEPRREQCRAVTKRDVRCRRAAYKDTGLCGTHRNSRISFARETSW
jgi:hypothetical protein